MDRRTLEGSFSKKSSSYNSLFKIENFAESNRRSATQILKNNDKNYTFSEADEFSRQERISRLLRTLSMYDSEPGSSTG